MHFSLKARIEKYGEIYKEENENDFDKMTWCDKDYRLSNKKEKETFVTNKLSKLNINWNRVKTVNRNKNFLTAFDGKCLYSWRMVDKDS